jgi:hypothetical protein
MIWAVERIFFTLVLGLVPVMALVMAKEWPVRASIVVLFLGSLGVILGLVQLLLDFKAVRSGAAAPQRPTFDTEAMQHEGRWGSLEIWGWLAGLFAAVHLIGFLAALPLFVFLYAKVYGARWATALILGGATFGFLYGVFEQILHVPWPKPLLQSLFSLI